jgi:hypothetical protein
LSTVSPSEHNVTLSIWLYYTVFTVDKFLCSLDSSYTGFKQALQQSMTGRGLPLSTSQLKVSTFCETLLVVSV